MKDKSLQEKNAAERQVELITSALGDAADCKGYWLNAAGKNMPKFYPKGVSVSPFNALVMGLNADRNGYKTNLYTLYNDAKNRGESVREHEKGVPFNWYNWSKYVNRHNPEDIIPRKDYLTLSKEEQKQYKGVHNREIRVLFNIDQTLLPMADPNTYEAVLAKDGGEQIKAMTPEDDKKLRVHINEFIQKMRDNLVAVRADGSGVAHYDSQKDAIYMPPQNNYAHYNDYVQEMLRQVVSATGHQQRLAREGMVMKNGMGPSEDALKQERLIVEVASGIKMLELGLPARLSDKSLELVDYWNRELKENPNLVDALESDVNNALEVIHKAERGEKIEYATMRNRRQTSDMQEQLPKHFYVADEIRKHPNKEDKTIVIVIDPSSKSADVILPAGASPEVDNEVPGMNKARIGRALRREGIENVRFFNPDGAWGYRPDDTYFAQKQVSLARLKNWALEMLSTLDVTPAVKRADEIGFDQVQMIQDDKNRWALYLKPEHQSGYSIYPDKDDLNRFFSTLKQSMDNIENVRMELAHKYYALAETQPDLKVDLFSSGAQDIDLNRIQRVSVFKTKQEGTLCVATIDGKKLQPRSVTRQQWQRMWVAEDRAKYKCHLAATLFADVLRKGQTQEESAGKKQGEEDTQQQDKDKNPKQTAGEAQKAGSSLKELSIKDMPEQLYGKYEQIKEEQPEAVVLFKQGNNYYASMYDAETIANELNLPPSKERVPYDANKIILVFEHDNEETRQQIHALRAYVMDCDGMSKAQQNGPAETTDEENEQRPTMRR